MSILVIALLVILTFLQKKSTSNERIFAIIGLVYMSITTFELRDSSDIDDWIFDEQHNYDSKSAVETKFLLNYLDSIIDLLKNANIHMNNIKLSNTGNKNIDINIELDRLNSIYNFLNRIQAPDKYIQFHKDILFQLESFLQKYEIKDK